MLPLLVVGFLPTENARIPAVVTIRTTKHLEGPRHIDTVDDIGAGRDPLSLSIDIESQVVEVDGAGSTSAVVKDPVHDTEVIVRKIRSAEDTFGLFLECEGVIHELV